MVWGPAQARAGHGSWYEPGKWGIVAEMGATIQDWDSRLPESTRCPGQDLAPRDPEAVPEIGRGRGFLSFLRTSK